MIWSAMMKNDDQRDADGPSVDKFARAWIAFSRGQKSGFWAWNHLTTLVDQAPEDAWPLILKLVSDAPDDRALGAIGAGPLEELLGAHGLEFIDRACAIAKQDERFRRCLRGVWPSEKMERNGVSQRIEECVRGEPR
jgi:hypothetical protein